MEEIKIPKQQLTELLNKLEEKDAELKALYNGSIKVMELVGLAENGKIKAECFEEGANPIPEVIKGGSSIMSLVMQSQTPFIGKKAEAKLTEKFSFFKDLIPLFIKYGNQYGQ